MLTNVSGTQLLPLLAGDLKVVIYAEHARNHVGPDSRHGEIALVVYDACQRHIAVFHDDVDGMPAVWWIVGDAAARRAMLF